VNNNRGNKDSAPEQESIKEMLLHLASNFTSVVRGELTLVVQSLGEKIDNLQTGLLLIVAAIFVGFTALLALCAAAIIQLLVFMSAAKATLTVAGVLAIISFVLAFYGYKKTKK
jgi:uncharacterized membrane protein YqjE